MTTAPEERIGEAVAAWARRNGCEVYGEVVLPGSKHRHDMVLVKAGEVAICECKLHLGIEVLAQVSRWREWAHCLWVATGPVAERYVLEWERLLGGVGVGWIVWRDGLDGGIVTTHVYPASAPAPRRVLLTLAALRPEHMDAHPGSASGGYYTPTDERDARLRELVAAQPQIELRQALTALGLRMTAQERRQFAYALRMGRVDGVGCEREGRRVYLRAKERTL